MRVEHIGDCTLGWFVWDRAHEGETVLRMLDRNDDARQGALL